MKNCIKLFLLIAAAIIGGNPSFEAIRIFLLIILLFVLIEAIYKIDSFFTQRKIRKRKRKKLSQNRE